MTTLDVEISRAGDDYFIIGDIDFKNVNAWRAAFDKVIRAEATKQMRINFSRIRRIDSTVLSLMLTWLRQAESLGIKVTYIDIPEHLLRISKLFGIQEMLPVA